LQRPLMLLLTAVLLIALLAFTVTYTVRFTEKGVLTTFGKADQSAVIDHAGLGFKWPYPIQSVTKYDTRTRILQPAGETQQTADSRQVIVEAFCTWRVEDPLKFFQRFSNAGERAGEHYKQAREILEGNLRASLSQISRYRLNDLFTEQPDRSKLPELEGKILTAMTAVGGDNRSLADDGIKVVDVGISRIRLPDETTKAVFDRMKADRERLVQDLESQGVAEAQGIRSSAENAAKTIRSFAENLAQEIRAKGEKEATPFMKQQDQFPELAVFLKNMELIRETMAKRITLVLPITMPGLEMVSPNALDGLKSGELPKMGLIRALSGDTAVTEKNKKAAEISPLIASPAGAPTSSGGRP
jgi:membrane protease subunit HflC